MTAARIRLIAALVILTLIMVIGARYWRSPSEPAGRRNLASSTGMIERLSEGGSLVPPQPQRRYRIGVLFPFLASPFWVNEAYGVLDQAQRAGVEVVWMSADGYDNIDKQNSQMEDLVTQRVDAILLAATSSGGTAPAVDRASRAGVPVFTHVTSSSSKHVISAVVNDDLDIGRKQAQFMGEALQGRGRIGMLNGPAAADWATLRARGFKEVLAEKFPAVQIVAERFGVPDRADARRLAEDLLTADARLNGMFTVADGMAMGAADAAFAAQRIDGLVITTASFSRETLPYLRKGHIDLNVDENPVVMGRVALNTVIRALNGERVPGTIYVPSPSITARHLPMLDLATRWAPEDWQLPR